MPAWKAHCLVLLATLAGLLGIGYAAALVVDPYDAIRYSPPLDRLPLADRRRFTLPAVARNPRFDSLILGTSTTMLLRPEQLDSLFDARFANLAMPSATPYEQLRLLGLFARDRDQFRNLIVGVDGAWCNTDRAPDFLGRQGAAGFPDWIYDDIPWNDFPVPNTRLVTDTVQQAAILLGRRQYATRADGYFEFPTWRYGRYDAAKVARKLHGAELAHYRNIPASIVSGRRREPESWVFGDVQKLRSALSELPSETRKLLYLVPYHINILPEGKSPAGQAWASCKAALASIGEQVENLYVVDFMLPGDLTGTDSNYWDPLHYTLAVARDLAILLRQAVAVPEQAVADYRVLAAP